jgi:hypothetical protein
VSISKLLVQEDPPSSLNVMLEGFYYVERFQYLTYQVSELLQREILDLKHGGEFNDISA